MMGDAGLTPEQVLMSATSVSASCLDLDDRGVIAPGMLADFMVLRENPLESLQNTRSLEQVYVAGQPVR